MNERRRDPKLIEKRALVRASENTQPAGEPLTDDEVAEVLYELIERTSRVFAQCNTVMSGANQPEEHARLRVDLVRLSDSWKDALLRASGRSQDAYTDWRALHHPDIPIE